MGLPVPESRAEEPKRGVSVCQTEVRGQHHCPGCWCGDLCYPAV
uniref:Uncharacterized protein n=1 Tax=Anguilla anguilla TaxID=7936 RepID=A0A0E9XLZ5_ANGAN